MTLTTPGLRHSENRNPDQSRLGRCRALGKHPIATESFKDVFLLSMKIKQSSVLNLTSRLVDRIKIGLAIVMLTGLTGCIGFVGGDGYYGDGGYVGGWWWGDGGWWGGGGRGYDRGHDVHGYSARGAASRGAAHGGGGHASGGGGHASGGGGHGGGGGKR